MEETEITVGPARPSRGRRKLAAIGLVAAGVVGGAVVGGTMVAGAQDATQTPSARHDETKAHHEGETLLTGTTAEKVKAAALKAVPGGTILRVETDAEGSPYEAHMRNADGDMVTVKVNDDFEVTEIEEGHGRGHEKSGESNSGSGSSSSGTN